VTKDNTCIKGARALAGATGITWRHTQGSGHIYLSVFQVKMTIATFRTRAHARAHFAQPNYQIRNKIKIILRSDSRRFDYGSLGSEVIKRDRRGSRESQCMNGETALLNVQQTVSRTADGNSRGGGSE
jgi:hypothetical protein